MKLKLTPLNFATAFFVVMAFVSWYTKASLVAGSKTLQWGGTIAIVYIVLAVAAFFLDATFRYFFTETKRLWIVELSFIVFTAVLYLLAAHK
ncbi:hypothetical protein GCM10027037_07090 [Mucilaginibacter koreensis]